MLFLNSTGTVVIEEVVHMCSTNPSISLCSYTDCERRGGGGMGGRGGWACYLTVLTSMALVNLGGEIWHIFSLFL